MKPLHEMSDREVMDEVYRRQGRIERILRAHVLDERQVTSGEFDEESVKESALAHDFGRG